MRVLARPPEYARATRSWPSIASSIRSSSRATNVRTSRGATIVSRNEFRVTREEPNELVQEVGFFDANLLLRVPLANRDPVSFERVVVDRHAERRADFVHARVPPADRAGVIVERREVLSEARVQRLRSLG